MKQVYFVPPLLFVLPKSVSFHTVERRRTVMAQFYIQSTLSLSLF